MPLRNVSIPTGETDPVVEVPENETPPVSGLRPSAPLQMHRIRCWDLRNETEDLIKSGPLRDNRYIAKGIEHSALPLSLDCHVAPQLICCVRIVNRLCGRRETPQSFLSDRKNCS